MRKAALIEALRDVPVSYEPVHSNQSQVDVAAATPTAALTSEFSTATSLLLSLDCGGQCDSRSNNRRFRVSPRRSSEPPLAAHRLVQCLETSRWVTRASTEITPRPPAEDQRGQKVPDCGDLARSGKNLGPGQLRAADVAIAVTRETCFSNLSPQAPLITYPKASIVAVNPCSYFGPATSGSQVAVIDFQTTEI
jgi:hypothetical protein